MDSKQESPEKQSFCEPGSSCCNSLKTGLTRREFLARSGAASAAAMLFASLPRWATASGEVRLAPHLIPKDKDLSPGWVKALTERGEPEVYMGNSARTIGMPVGGIGAGQLYLCGDGSLGLWEIFNEHVEHPHGAQAYARRTIPKPVRHGLALYWKVGDEITAKMLDQSGFDGVGFRNMHPVGVVYYGSENAPVKVTLEAFSPFIPLNAKDSALPTTIMMVTVENVSDKLIEVGTASWLENPIGKTAHSAGESGVRATAIRRSDNGSRISHSAMATPPPSREPRSPILFEDFEGKDLAAWKIEGTAFGDAPTTGNLPTQQDVFGWEGAGFAGSFRNRDSTTGKLVSRPFTIERRYVNFKIGGGRHIREVGIRLYIDGKQVRTQAGTNNEELAWKSWNVSDFEGQQAHLEIVDDHTGGWGHIQVDHIEFADIRRTEDGPDSFEEFPDVGTLAWGVTDRTLDADAAAKVLQLLGADAEGVLTASQDSEYPLDEIRAHGLVTSAITLQPGDEKTFTHVLTWHFPNTVAPDREAGHEYASRFADANAVLDYVLENQDRLVSDTFNWRDTYYDSTLPWWLLERIHLTSCCLATGTTMWWKNGRFWAYEGVVCCVGTCTHVYNYVQTTARLFPELERNLRERQDLMPGVGLEESGLVGFRHNGAYAADGQCGTVLKVYREHMMSADDSFLKRNWAATRKVLDYSISRDGNADGILEDSQHNTYDVDFYGPNTFVGALYLAALRAGEEMAREMGEVEYAEKLHAIFEKGKRWTEEKLWNGEYFFQEVDLGEHGRHQYGPGCLSDQLFGQNWAHQLNLGYVYSPDKVRRALESVWTYNWAPDLGVYNAVFPAQRVFAEAQEAGLFNCTWPKSEHLDDGVLYRDEVWSGVEYQVASHMVYEGMLTDALAMCRAVHDRYDPAKRNPFNEIECSDYYARAMASWGMLLALSGYQYHGPKGELAINPRINPPDFRCAFTAAEGWGTIAQRDAEGGREWLVKLKHGRLKLATLKLGAESAPNNVSLYLDRKPLQVTFSYLADDKSINVNLPPGTVIELGSEVLVSSK